MNINDENIDVTHSKNNVTHSDDEQCHTQEYPIISDVTHPKNNVTHSNVTHQKSVTQSNVTHPICDTILNIRMPQKLKDEIHRQAEELGMSTSSLAKAVLAQAFIK